MKVIKSGGVYEIDSQVLNARMYEYKGQRFLVNGEKLYAVDKDGSGASLVSGMVLNSDKIINGTRARVVGMFYINRFVVLVFTFDDISYYVCEDLDGWRFSIRKYRKAVVDGFLVPYNIKEVKYKDYVLLVDEGKWVSFLVKGYDVIRLGLKVGINRVKEAIDEGLVDFLVNLSNMKVPYVGGVYIEEFLRYKRIGIRKLYERMKESWVVEELLLGEGLPVRQLKLAEKLVDKVEECKDVGSLSIESYRNYDVFIYSYGYRILAFYSDFKKEIASWVEEPFLIELYKKYPLSRKLDEEGLKVWASVIKRYGVRYDSEN